ncbi:MAG: hypothetical protein EPO41_08810 [Reyranella sp.]|uniref:WbqC family protein n=1 Tax=Reyranella sp. TaxID=1929291 RepID=UPI0012274A1B|nr:WbqC family protein [Reyranella sp.]TAJ95327.1 MAG: hypothetical protein EPO41_08810 [Reyranella sp.]
MKLGVMQPYFFPYFQQFRMIAQCDAWIAFDTVKYSRQAWISRNRIINREKGWTWLSVPVTKGATAGSISEARLAKGNWRKQVMDRLRVYEHEAPQYEEIRGIVAEGIATEAASIGELNSSCIRLFCRYLGIETAFHDLSKMGLPLPHKAARGEWPLHICKAVGAQSYINAAGGRHLYDPAKFNAAGVSLEFYEPIDLKYETGSFRFEPDLSIIDTLMWLPKQHLQALIRK